MISYKQVRLNVLLSWRVFILTDILQKDLNSRYVRCSANSMGSRWSKRSDTFLFLLLLALIFWLAFHDQSRSVLEHTTKQNVTASEERLCSSKTS